MQTKGRDEVTTLPYRTLAEGAAIQPARNIGAAVVAGAQGRVLGMLSERDILQAVGTGDPAALEDASSKHMMTPVVATEENECVHTPMEKDDSPALPPPTGRRST
jgi:CBS domain-containing protein